MLVSQRSSREPGCEDVAVEGVARRWVGEKKNEGKGKPRVGGQWECAGRGDEGNSKGECHVEEGARMGLRRSWARGRDAGAPGFLMLGEPRGVPGRKRRSKGGLQEQGKEEKCEKGDAARRGRCHECGRRVNRVKHDGAGFF